MAYKIQEIFKQSFSECLKNRHLSTQQQKIAKAIIKCKTASLGGHNIHCEDCGHDFSCYNSCKNRHCPCCQTLAKEKWVDKTKAMLVDAPYFHTVFTVPHELNDIFYSNQKIMYNLFYKTVSQTLKELSLDPKHKLEADIGFISILHTWGRNISYHPHIHVIVLAGGLNDKDEFVQRKDDFLFPFPVMKKLFRGKFMDQLYKLWTKNKLDHKPISDVDFIKLKKQLYKKEWVVYAKKAFNRAENVIEYLGRYTHNIAISNNRILCFNDKTVLFKYKDYKSQKEKKMTLSTTEFIRRFLMHVLPKGFVKIRYFGIFANRNKKKKISLIRTLIKTKVYLPELINMSNPEIILKIFKVNVNECKVCKSTNLITRKISPYKLE